MEKQNNSSDKSTWAVGGGVLLGVGIGLIYLQQSALAFVGCTIAGLGVGLVITALLSKVR